MSFSFGNQVQAGKDVLHSTKLVVERNTRKLYYFLFTIKQCHSQGKPVNLAKKMDIPRASINFRVFAQVWSLG